MKLARLCLSRIPMAPRAPDCEQPFDWRDRSRYNYTMPFTDREWAWEGLRRNPAFRCDWQRAHQSFEFDQAAPEVRIVRASDARYDLSRWGILYSDPPHIDAGCAAVVWQTRCICALDAIALSAEISSDRSPFRLSDAHCSALVVFTPDGFQHVLFYCAGCSVQLRVSGASVLQPMHLLTDAAPRSNDLKSRLQTLALFHELRTLGKCRSARGIPKGRANRLRLVVQALDGFLAKASLREIGIALFGAERVEKDWDDDHRHLKDRVRRAVARGRWLMEGGYRKYLK